MLDNRIITGFLKTANITKVSSESRVSRPTLIAMKKGDFSHLQYSSVKQVSDYIEGVITLEDE